MENEMIGFGSITVICYVAAIFVKRSRIQNDWIPAICGVLGILLGIVGYYTVWEFPADDILNAAAVGAVSGLAATGANQVSKTIGKCRSSVKETEHEG